jgi:hypothetical protein
MVDHVHSAGIHPARRLSCRRLRDTVVCSWLILFFASLAAGAEAPRPLEFERDVWPILAVHCTHCHGADKPKADLDLRSVAAMLRGGESGPALVRSDPDASLLVQKIVDGEMPPPKERKLSPDETAVLREWVRSGARAVDANRVPLPVSAVRDQDRAFWSFRPLARPDVPPAGDTTRVRTPLDAFLLAKLEPKGLTFSPDADRTTLLRRASLDLLGLPPSPEDIAAFLSDDASGAYERLLDRLLASPHFGERWGRHWLDVAGYVDTIGFDTDATNIMLSDGKWLYRDYVIRAFNEDKPYDRFVTEQLAGDELFDWRRAEHFTPEIREALVATGYLRTARDLTHEGVGVIPQNFFGIMHDTLEIMGTGLLGLTLNCARCHSHKFDPIPQEDYYRLMAVLTPAYNPVAWRPVIPFEPKIQDRGLPDVSSSDQADITRHNEQLDQQLTQLRKTLSDVKGPHATRLFEERLATVPEVIRADTKTALQTTANKRTEVQKYLAGKFAGLVVKSDEVTAALNPAEKAVAGELESQILAVEAKRRKWGKIQALYDVGAPPPTRLLVRGSEETPGAEVPPGFLQLLCKSESDAIPSIVSPTEGTSGRRTALARWLTNADSPAAALLARVMVNRVWQHLFGRGIVPTTDNFGQQGQPPSHPELLEWLSARFVEGGWRIKPLVKLMMTSTAYRQASQQSAPVANSGNADPEQVDPGNELLWRMRLRRLESEVVRDSILTVSGKLNRAAGGPPILINARPDGMVVVASDRLASPAEQWRRSVYLVGRRAYNLSLLTIFDQPLVATNCLRRDTSAVPLQSLVMLNDAFLAEQAEYFASRIERMAAPSAESRVEAAFCLALARQPNANEKVTCNELLKQQTSLGLSAGAAPEAAERQALVQLCQTLLNTSEFLYVE